MESGAPLEPSLTSSWRPFWAGARRQCLRCLP